MKKKKIEELWFCIEQARYLASKRFPKIVPLLDSALKDVGRYVKNQRENGNSRSRS